MPEKSSESIKKLSSTEALGHCLDSVKGLESHEIQKIIHHLELVVATLRSEWESVIQKNGEITLEDAEKTMEGNFLGPEAIQKTFGIVLAKEQIPPIPFSQKELEKARERDLVLVLRVFQSHDREPLTMKKMNEMVVVMTDPIVGSPIKYIQDVNPFYDQAYFLDIPRAGWALVSKDILSLSENSNALDQAFVLAEEAMKLFSLSDLPISLQCAIQELQNQSKAIEQLLIAHRSEAFRRICGLKIYQHFGRRPAESVYDSLLSINNIRKKSPQIIKSERIVFLDQDEGHALRFMHTSAFGLRAQYYAPQEIHPDLGIFLSWRK